MFDLATAVALFEDLDKPKAVTCLGKYLKAAGLSISRAEGEQRMFEKLEDPSFLADVRPLLSADEAEKLDDAKARAVFETVFTEFIKRLPGHAWADTPETAKRLGVPGLARD
jgi:hypothetical protein